MKRKILIVIFTLISVLLMSGVVLAESPTDSSEFAGDNITYTIYNNYYFLNLSKYEEIAIYSLNNKDSEAYFRPKLEDLDISLEDTLNYYYSTYKVAKNGFDVDYTEVNKSNVDSSRELEILGYDFLLKEDYIDPATGVIHRTPLDNNITSGQFIMDTYKALGIELYDVYYRFDNSDTCGVYVSRTRPETYWKLFMNDHPINYDVYNNINIGSLNNSETITGTDAISILAQMMNFYGEPVITKDEEYKLLQAYGKSVPVELEPSVKEAWSYLKCRGIIGEESVNYDAPLDLNTLLLWLSRVKDPGSRHNYKTVQITTNLESEFTSNGFYETQVTLRNQPQIIPEEVHNDFSKSNRIDFLIEVDSNITFKNPSTGELSSNLFLSTEDLANGEVIPGSVYHGIEKGRFYHFSAPKSVFNSSDKVYINSRDFNDRPIAYTLPSGSGGVYSSPKEDSEGIYNFSKVKTFDEVLPDSFYVDQTRLNGAIAKIGSSDNKFAKSIKSLFSTKEVKAATFDTVLFFDKAMLDVEASKSALNELSNISVADENKNGKDCLRITVAADSNTSRESVVFRVASKLKVADSKVIEIGSANAILTLKGDGLLVNVDDATKLEMIEGYKYMPDKNTLILYLNNKDIVFVDNKHKVIQKGNTYMQINEQQSLYRIDNGQIMVDFRALYGVKEVGFQLKQDTVTGGIAVEMFDNALSPIASTEANYKNNSYFYHSAEQFLPYRVPSGDFVDALRIKEMNVDVLCTLNSDGTVGSDVFLPLGSSNPMGNYILYCEYDRSYSIESYYLVTFGIDKVMTSAPEDKKIEDIFWYRPDPMPIGYKASVKKLTVSDTGSIRNINGTGWCYKLETTDYGDIVSDVSSYTAGTLELPMAVNVKGSDIKLINMNMNYYPSGDTYKTLAIPKEDANVVPAAVGVQAWVTDPELTTHVSWSTISTNKEKAPLLFFGTQRIVMNSAELKTDIGNLSIEQYRGSDIVSMNKFYTEFKGEGTYQSPGLYNVLPSDLNVSVSAAKEKAFQAMLNLAEIGLQDFFDKFKDISFLDLIQGLDNSMSIVYFLVVYGLPIVIMTLLILILIMSRFSDMKIVQLFCDKVFDPVKIMTLGNYTIHTVNNQMLLISLIVALALMGMIQMGNLEKIIKWVLEWIYQLSTQFI